MLNIVHLIGHVGQDPKTNTLQDGTVVTSFSLATNENWKDQQGNKQSKTTWHNCQAWRRLGEVCSQYLKKGSLVYASGKINNRSYEKDGETKYTSEIVLSTMQMLGGKTQTQQTQQQPATQQEQQKADGGDVPDDLPF